MSKKAARKGCFFAASNSRRADRVVRPYSAQMQKPQPHSGLRFYVFYSTWTISGSKTRLHVSPT